MHGREDILLRKLWQSIKTTLRNQSVILSMKYFLLFITLISFVMNAQDLKKHQWQNRLIIISSPTFENQKAALQLSYLTDETMNLQDRKLIVYHVTNTGYTTNFKEEIIPSINSEFEIEEFTVSLIGLDGTQKYEATSPQPASAFFNLIDQMPMRKAEIKNRE